jgi:tetratricopeptide (TPR) repeat protein
VSQKEERSLTHNAFVSKRVRHRRAGISKKILLGVLGGLMLCSFGVFSLYLYLSQEPEPAEKLEIALRWLNKGELDTAARIAESIPEEALKRNADKSAKLFVLGVEARTKAKEIDQYKVATQLNEEAVKKLKQSRSLSFPQGFAGIGNYHLGMALYELFRWKEAVEPLQIAFERYPIGRADALECLVDIDLSRGRRDYKGALARIAHWRSLPQSGEFDSERADLKEMQALIAKGQMQDAIKLGTRIPETYPYRPKCEQLLGKAYREMAAALDASPDDETRKGYLADATRHLAACLKSTKTPVSIRRQANLELGFVQRDSGQLTDAISTFSILRLSSPFEPEGLAAGLEELDALIKTNRTDEVLVTLDQINNLLYDLKVFDTDQLPLSVVRERFVKLANDLIDSKAFPVANSFIKRMPRMCTDLDRLKLDSRNYNDWAVSLEDDPKSELSKLEYYKNSAKAYRELTRRLPLDDQYDQWLWTSIENFRKGHAYKESNEVLKQFLAYENRENRPKGFLVRARNFSSMEDSSEAATSLLQIVDSNVPTPLIYDARFELAKIRAASEQYDEAEKLLLENLSGDLKPESAIWRESLYTLGAMLFSRGEKMLIDAKNAIELNPSQTLQTLSQVEASHNMLKGSVVRIEDFLRRFETDDRRFHSLYQIAKAYQLASFWPEIQLRENTVTSEDSSESLKAQRKSDLANSRASYKRLRQEIIRDTAIDPKSSSLKELLRNSYFGEADLYFYDGAYEDAMTAYSEAANWFVNEPESLEARKQIAVCQKRLGNYADSRRSVEYAKSMLQRIPADRDDRFKVTTAMDRAAWETYLNAMLAELDDLEKAKP